MNTDHYTDHAVGQPNGTRGSGMVIAVTLIILPLMAGILFCASTARVPAAPPLAASPPAADGPDYEVVRITTLTTNGGRVDWSPDGEWIYYDRLGQDGFWDVYRIHPDGSGDECLTCDQPALPNKNQGQPEVHPGGRYLVFQAEKADHLGGAGDPATGPGRGYYNDLWVLDLESGDFHQLTDVSAGSPPGGSLHAHFSNDGTRLLWGDLEGPGGRFGDWQLAVADFITSPTPYLTNTVYYNPGPQPVWLEAHGWGPDDSWIYFTCTPVAGMDDNDQDICRMDFSNPTEVTRLTFTSGLNGERGEWDEHAHLSPLNDAFSWVSSKPYGTRPLGSHPEWLQTELWLMNVDGSGQQRITFFNDAEEVIVADNDWNPVATEEPQLALSVFMRDRSEVHIKIIRFAPKETFDTCELQVVDNGGFEEAVPPDALGAFWLTDRGGGRFDIPTGTIKAEVVHSGTYALKLTPDDAPVLQYLPALGSLADGTVVSGSLYLTGDVTATLAISDSHGNQVVYLFALRPAAPPDDATHHYVTQTIPFTNTWHGFSLPYGQDYRAYFGGNPLPPFTLSLSTQGDDPLAVYWDDLATTVLLRQESEADLRQAVLDEARWAISNTLTYAIDDVGEPSPYIIKTIDAVTGRPLTTGHSSLLWPVYDLILKYLDYEYDQDYYDAVVAMADALMDNISPNTHLPRRYDGVADEPVEGQVHPASVIHFLLDVHELTGDEKYLTAASEMGQAILEFGPRLGITVSNPISIPTGYLPNIFDSATGNPAPISDTYQLHIRWFESPAALMHLYSATGNADLYDAAVDAALSYTDHDTVLQYWGTPYTLTPFSFEPTWYDWDQIDPAFDDYFGYGIGGREGARGLLDIYERSGEEALLPFLDDSLAYILPVWEEGLYRGGHTAGDQARGWEAFYDRYLTDPDKYAAHRDLLLRNARNVFRGTQYRTGAWTDMSFRRWSPEPAGGYVSCPRNLLTTLSWAYALDGEAPSWRAMLASVFHQTIAQYKYDYGYILTPEVNPDGTNPGGAEFRLLDALLTHLLPHLEALPHSIYLPLLRHQSGAELPLPAGRLEKRSISAPGSGPLPGAGKATRRVAADTMLSSTYRREDPYLVPVVEHVFLLSHDAVDEDDFDFSSGQTEVLD